nr:unnamed protein product [Callosobruchus analis]
MDRNLYDVPDESNLTSNSQQPGSHEGSSVQISGITLGADARHPAQPVAPATENTPFKPPRPGGMFARLIDDIFQVSKA